MISVFCFGSGDYAEKQYIRISELFQRKEVIMINRKKQRLVAAIICGVLVVAMVFGLVATMVS